MTGEGVSRGSYAKSAARREAILEAARAAFADRGYESTSLRDIAERVGITHAGVLHHFADKRALLVALLARRDEEEHRRAGLADDQSDDQPAVPSSGRDLLGEFLREHQQSPELMRLWAELAPAAARPDHPAHDYFVQRYRRVREAFTAALSSRPLDERVDPATAAALFVAVLDGLQTQWLLDASIDVVDAVTRFRALLGGPNRPS